MKSSPQLIALLAALAFVPAVAFGGEPPPYSLEASSIDGGGGVSEGGDFMLIGSLGQPDVGEQSGGPFTLSGGIWAGIQQTPGAPPLGIRREPTGEVTVFWPFPSTGFVLRESPTLGQAPTTWADVPPLFIQNDGVINFVTIADPSGENYYALFAATP
jgi:hypothetical protein